MDSYPSTNAALCTVCSGFALEKNLHDSRNAGGRTIGLIFS